MDKSKLRIRFLFFTIIFFIIINGATFNSRAETDLLEIQEPVLPQIDRTWSNISLLYDNYFHNSSEVDLEINRFHELVPAIIDMEVIGKSYLGKDITALRITNELRTQQKAKTLVVSHHHGREQISVEIALRFILYLLNNYNISESVTDYIDNQEIFIIPTLNPDALDLVVNEGNHWLRKNVRPFDDDGDGVAEEDPLEDVDGDGFVSSFDVYDNTGTRPIYLYTYYEGIDNDADGLINEDMVGFTDLNRNYDSFWRDGNSWSPDSQSQIYPGPSPFSEPETQAFRDFALKHRFGMTYSLHSGINTTFFTDDENGWVEPSLYWQMIQDYAQILPPSYTEIYSNPNEISFAQKEYATLAGGWDTWMYFERDSLAPITFELYSNASSVALGSEEAIVDNSTHLILEWKEIYGYFNPIKEAINALWQDVRPGFVYLLENTPRINATAMVLSGGFNQGDEVNISFNINNLSPRIKTIETINLYAENGTIIEIGIELSASGFGNMVTQITLPYDLTENSYKLKLGNEFVGYLTFILGKSIATEKSSGLTLYLSIVGVIIISRKNLKKHRK